jgi:glycine betaine/choline ABC-type transport system substrate-binding protein
MKKLLWCVILLFVLACKHDNTIVIGSKNFSEQILLGEILAQKIEQSGIKVKRKLNLGGSFICQKALLSGDIDMYVEYTGTAYTAILKRDPKTDEATVLNEVKDAYHSQYHLAVLPSLGFNNTFAIIIRGAEAKRLGIHTISQAATYTPQWKAGFGYEFMERKDGFPGLAAAYGLKFAQPPKVMDLTLTYRAVADKEVDMIAGNSTDGLIQKLDLFVLEDDKHYFPPYEAVPVVRENTLAKYPQLETIISSLAGKISADKMRAMNLAVDGQHREVRDVAAEFLKGVPNR